LHRDISDKQVLISYPQIREITAVKRRAMLSTGVYINLFTLPASPFCRLYSRLIARLRVRSPILLRGPELHRRLQVLLHLLFLKGMDYTISDVRRSFHYSL